MTTIFLIIGVIKDLFLSVNISVVIYFSSLYEPISDFFNLIMIFKYTIYYYKSIGLDSRSLSKEPSSLVE